MEPEKWQANWREGKLGFHQKRFNSRLEQFWPTLGLPTDASVLVPLCGKSLDMLYLHEAGHRVVGVELSEIAAEAFFSENQLTFEKQETGNLQEFTGTGTAAGIRLLTGDIFDLQASQTGPLNAFYDRASLIALPTEIRQRYAVKLSSLLRVGARGLLISIIYDPSKMNGPPFSVPDEEVRGLFADNFDLQQLDISSGPERLGNLAERGLDTMEERVYALLRA